MITITILTKNSQALINDVLESVEWADEVIVFDSGSTDNTLKIARAFANVRVVEGKFSGFGPARNEAAKLASNEWIFALDSDEVMTPELAYELQNLVLDPKVIYSVQRYNFFYGKRIRFSGWGGDFCQRLYHRKVTRFSSNKAHSYLVKEGLSSGKLKGVLHHFAFSCINDFIQKIEINSTLFAKQYKHQRKSGLFRALGHKWAAFVRVYFLKGGLFDGALGYIIAQYHADLAYYKYLKLKEINADLLPTTQAHFESPD